MVSIGFAEALRGVTSIRAFSKEHQFRHRLCKIVDETLAFWYLSATLDVSFRFLIISQTSRSHQPSFLRSGSAFEQSFSLLSASSPPQPLRFIPEFRRV